VSSHELSEQDLDDLVEVGHLRLHGEEGLHPVCRRLVTCQLVAPVRLRKAKPFLANVPSLGARRLDRLYAAGQCAVDPLIEAR
jgi:hypothetical protein